MAVEIAAVFGLIATTIIAAQAREKAAALGAGAAALILAILAVILVIQLARGKLSRYVVGEPQRAWKITKEAESSLLRRLAKNSCRAVIRYFQRLSKFHTLSPYKTAVIAAAIVSAAISVLI